MNKLSVLLVLAGGLLASHVAQAQNNLGELRAAGATKVEGTEVKSLVSGSNLSGPTLAGGTSSVDLKADGSYTGTFLSPGGRGGGSFGTWKIDDSGRICTEGTAQSYSATQTANCNFLFRLGGDYYIVIESDADPAARALKRTIKR